MIDTRGDPGTEPLTPLEVSEIRYRRLFEGARDGIFILDLITLKIVDANPYIQELLGYSKEELLGKELWEIGLFKDQLESQVVYRELLNGKYVRYDDLPLQSKDGHARHVEVVSNVYDEGDHSVIQCNIRDMSQRKLLDDQRVKLVQAEKLNLLGQMARGVAHDLNQSLGLITGYCDLAIATLTEPILDRPGLRDMLEILAQAATDGGQIVTRLLTFARGHPEGSGEMIPLPALLVRVGQLTAPRWRDIARTEGRPITLHVEAEPDAAIMGWPTSLREALVNLIFNAVDALPKGGSIHLRALRRGESVAIEVQDSGTGMSAEVQSQIFRPLFTTKGRHGTGLGLTQVLTMVEHHAGQISIDSVVGQGTTFRMVFAAAPGDSADGSARPQRNLSTLIVDDEPALAELLVRMVTLEGHLAVPTYSGAAALERLSLEHFDVVFSDMSMPNMDGWELSRLIRSQYPEMLIIIASAWGAQITPEETRERGILSVVAKPYRRLDIQNAIARVTERLPWAAAAASDTPGDPA